MKTGKILVMLISVCLMGLAGCTSSSPSSDGEQAQETQKEDATDRIRNALKNELSGLTNIENQIKKDDFENAHAAFENLHEDYHATVHPQLEEKNGKLAADMHNDFDALEKAINDKDKSKISQLLKINKENINTAAKLFGTSVSKGNE